MFLFIATQCMCVFWTLLSVHITITRCEQSPKKYRPEAAILVSKFIYVKTAIYKEQERERDVKTKREDRTYVLHYGSSYLYEVNIPISLQWKLLRFRIFRMTLIVEESNNNKGGTCAVVQL